MGSALFGIVCVWNRQRRAILLNALKCFHKAGVASKIENLSPHLRRHPMIPKPLEIIEATDIHALVANGDEERRTMDFKRDLPGNADKDKIELRADVTSFANAGGGDLIFGVDEAGGVATAVPGLAGINSDAEIRRIEAVIQSSIDPRVPGIESRAVAIPGKGPVIIVRVPKSWRGPHLAKINDTFRMFGRNSKGKYIFDATEIRSLFALSEQLPERIRRWRDDRLAKVIGGDAPVPLEDGSRLFIHLLPLSSFTGNIELSAGELVKQWLPFRPPGVSGWDHRVNIDGVIMFSANRGKSKRNNAYCQVFRSGRVEAVSTDFVRVREGRRIVSSLLYEQMMIEALASYLKGLKDLGLPLPIVALAAISGANGAWFVVPQGIEWPEDSTIDRDMLMLPDVLIETYAPDVPTLLRPVFDAVWNAAGWERSFNYDEKGKWTRPH